MSGSRRLPSQPAGGRRSIRLIVTADDVGLDRGMTAGAIRAHVAGIVTACSLVANGRHFDHAVEQLRETPTLDVGVHLALVEETALTTGQPMPKDYIQFLLNIQSFPIERELRAQIEKVLATGLRITHLNGHQHLHVWPSVFPIVQRLAEEYKLPWVRVPRDAGGRGSIPRKLAVGFLGALCKGKGRTIGITEAGHLTAARIVELLKFVEGTTELVTHPGIGVMSYAHWNYEWDAETDALCDPLVRDALAQRGIALIAPSDLATDAHV